ncbi:MAG TPA: ABC transporter ATP-binding protein [Limnochordales bacterium]
MRFLARERGVAMSQAILEVRNLIKEFGGIRAVDDCSFTVQKGSITGLIGPNGAGKTTAFNMVTGFIRPDRGEVRFRGERIDGLPPHVIFRKGIARTFQIPRELRLMTVLENLMLVPLDQGGEGLWRSWFLPGSVRAEEERIYRRALEVLEFVQLSHLRDELAANLSVGQKKLLELARVLMADPELILLDEPAAGVNPTLMKKLAGYVRTLRDQGKTFLLVEHNMDLIADLCDWVIVMNNGRRLVEGKPEEVRRHPQVLEAYLGGTGAAS